MTQNSWRAHAQKVAQAPAGLSFTDLVKLTLLDPGKDFEFADLSGVSFAGCDLSGFDFTGARLHGCDFTRARILGTNFRSVELDRVIHAPGYDLSKPARLEGITRFRRQTDLRRAADSTLALSLEGFGLQRRLRQVLFSHPNLYAMVGEFGSTHARFSADLTKVLLHDTELRRQLLQSNLDLFANPIRHRKTASAEMLKAILETANESTERPHITDAHLPTGAIFQDAPFAPEMVVVPSGSFWMGSRDGEGYEDEQPRHKVTVSYRFAAGRFPVTFEEWDVCHQDNGTKHKPNDLKWGRARRPVINVSWDHITNEYLPWLNKRLGLSGVHAYRLLTEAEWEYCCRAGTETAYSFGDKITTEQANFDGRDSQGRYLKRTADVGSFPSNGWGMHDMHGTVWEWCRDVFHETYESAPGDGSAREDAGSGARLRRVIRGGSWLNISRDFDSATRGELEAGEHYHYLGFRVARTLNP